MTALSLPSDSSSLLVPIHLEAWVVDESTKNAMDLARYSANYDNLSLFQSPVPEAFGPESNEPLDEGVHLHWALPDGLTHGRVKPDGKGLELPTVPNRWLVARFTINDAQAWTGKLWVVKSDNLKPIDLGTTANDFTGNSTEITLLKEGLKYPIGAADKIVLVPPQGHPLTVVTSAAAPKGATTVKVRQISSLADNVPANSSVRVPTSSAFLNPDRNSPTFAEVKVDGTVATTKTTVNSISIGTPFSIEAWEAHQDSGQGLFLTAVGPGNISFAAFAPYVENVFSFVDQDPPKQIGNQYKYTYLVVGWYSDPDSDPLQASAGYDNLPGFWQDLWPDKAAWQKQSPVERFQTLLRHLKWSTSDTTTPPPSSLYHAVLPGVVWAYQANDNESPIDKNNVVVAVGNTSIAALSALVAADSQDPDAQQLADLLEAAQYDLLKNYDQPGGQALTEQQIHQAWYGSSPGGILWEVVGTAPDQPDQDARPPTLTPDQTKAVDEKLAALNRDQRACDAAQRELASLQADLYAMWWKVGKSDTGQGWDGKYNPGELYPEDNTPQWGDLKKQLPQIYTNLFEEVWTKYCGVQAAAAKLPSPTDAKAAQTWADSNWKFPGIPTTEVPQPAEVNLSALRLRLKSVPMPRYWHPNDPVLLIRGLNRSQKHGEDGRESSDDKLRCRLPAETITGLNINGEPEIDVKTIKAANINLNPLGASTKVPDISNLIHEAFFVDPANAGIIAKAVQGDQEKIDAAIASQKSWLGTPSVSFAMTPWKQAWSPLFLEWELQYHPTGTGQAAGRQFTLDDWEFDGEQYHWKGTEAVTDQNTGVETGSGYDQDYFVSFQGRTFVTPQIPLTLKKKIQTYLKNHPEIDGQKLEDLLKTIGNWDLLSQSLSGFTNALLSLETGETFPPPPDPNEKIPCPTGSPPPSVTALIGGQYRAVPMLTAPEDPRFGGSRNHFYPVRGGFIKLQQLRVVDTFGQASNIDLSSSVPILAKGLIPDPPKTIPKGNVVPLPSGTAQLPPRVVQPSRLDFRWLANDASGQEIDVSDNPNAICGWLLPNHLDGGVSVYDSAGQPLGELLPPPYGWRPRPGDPGVNQPPETIDSINNAALKNVLANVWQASQANSNLFRDLLQVIDETLWMVDPLGGRKDQMLSVLIGRPLAVVQAQLQLDWYGNPAFDQLWQKMLRPQNYPPWQRVKDIGPISDISFPVRLGNLELRNDGLIGYFLPASQQAYGTFYCVHCTDDIEARSKYFKQIRKGSPSGWTYQGDITLRFPQPQPNDPVNYKPGDPVTYKSQLVAVTMLLDPRGCVHASTGILPTTSVALPAHRVEEFLKRLAVTFRAGPIIADPGALRTPQPAESRGSWTWVQRSTPTTWKEDTIVNSNDRARLADQQLQLREGWLKFTETGSKPTEGDGPER